jgi:phospholipid/cholesterol/gamma-HCH transport system substrate-binding protein
MAFGRNKKTSDDRSDRVLRKDRTGASPLKVGAVVLVIAAVLTFLGFTKDIPFTQGFIVKGVFQSAVSIRTNSPVRIAGVAVGKVKSVARKPGTDYSVVTMEINKTGLPIHKDATMKIRPRIFLEGNFFVDVKPGTPDAPRLGDGDTIPVSQTSEPVQFDQVLSALNSDTRQNLQKLLGGLGTGLTYKPSAAQDKGADPLARGQSAAESLNDSFKYGKRAFKGTAIVTDAFLGTQQHDLSRLVAGLSRVTEGLGRNEAQLKDLVTNFNTTVTATASQATNLRTTIRLLAPTLENADRALDSLNAAFPNTRAFAREILPGVRETPATINASFPWIAQTRKLLGPTELQGVARELSPTTRDLARVIDTSVQLLPQIDLTAKCATHNVLPTGDIKIQDGPLTADAENYKEFWYTMVGLAGEGQNFDGNGMYVRFQPGGGDQMVALGAGQGANAGQVFGNETAKPVGTRPAYPGRRPPYRPDVPCYTNAIPNLNGAATGVPDGSEAASRPGARAIARAAARSGGVKGALSLHGLKPVPAPKTAKDKNLLGGLNPFGTGTR